MLRLDDTIFLLCQFALLIWMGCQWRWWCIRRKIMRKGFLFEKVPRHDLLTFFAITLFYFFEAGQMSYFNVLAPTFLSLGIYHPAQIASLSAAYYYGDVVGLLPVGFMLDRF